VIRPKHILSRRQILVKTEMGVFLLEMTARGLYAVRFPKKAAEKGSLSSLWRVLRNRKLDLTGYTTFQLKVYAALRKVPSGKVVTYGQLAKRAGYSGAARAVGSAMKKNRLPIVIPCHRVIKGNGSLGQYSWGIQWKRYLLRGERLF